MLQFHKIRSSKDNKVIEYTEHGEHESFYLHNAREI